MATFGKINEKLYYEGSILRSLDEARDRDLCQKDRLFRIVVLSWRKNGSCTIGVYSPEERGNWHDLDEMTPNYHGLWFEEDEFDDLFQLERLRVVVVEKVLHRGKELIGRKGTYICPLDVSASMMQSWKIFTPESFFIEMDDNVGGSGCDGLGKKGHCVLVPRSAVKFEKQKEAMALQL